MIIFMIFIFIILKSNYFFGLAKTAARKKKFEKLTKYIGNLYEQ